MSDMRSPVESVIRVASRLIVVLEREVELLRAMKLSALSELQDEKNELVAAYEEQVRALTASPEALRKVAPALQEEFGKIAKRFESAMTENRRALSAANEAQKRFLNAVVEAAEEKRSSVKTYSADGLVAAGARRHAGETPLSLSVDRQL